MTIKDGNERETIQYAKDGVNFEIASSVSLTPTAAAPYTPDAFTNTDYGMRVHLGAEPFYQCGFTRKTTFHYGSL